MNKLLLLVLFVTSSVSFAGTIDVDCGTIKKVKETRKSLFRFPLNIITLGFGTDALKVKLKNSTTYNVSVQGFINTLDESKRSKTKLGYLGTDNYNKHLALIEEAIDIQDQSDEDVYVCFGKVTGLDRWHRIAEYSTVSKKDALEELIRKYN